MSQLFTQGQEVRWATAERHGAALVRRLLEIDLPAGVFVNVNYPDVDPDQVRGVRVARQGNWGRIHLAVDHRIDARNFPYAWLSFIHETGEPPSDTDLGAVHEGCISVTPLHTDITHHASLASLASGLASGPN
jgi:5'-nucleotidase